VSIEDESNAVLANYAKKIHLALRVLQVSNNEK